MVVSLSVLEVVLHEIYLNEILVFPRVGRHLSASGLRQMLDSHSPERGPSSCLGIWIRGLILPAVKPQHSLDESMRAAAARRIM
jgi:hypothetical protein